MTLKVLNRDQQFYINLFTRWLEVPALTLFERGMIIELHRAATKGLKELDETRGAIATSDVLQKTLATAIHKARAYGIK